MIYSNILDMVGDTPLIKLDRIKDKYKLKHNLYAKVEMFNPSGSVKIRAALQMIEDAIKAGLIKSDTVVIEPTSGNTGIALAMVCTLKKLKFICVMPESMSIERVKLMKAYGAEVILTSKELGMDGSVKKAKELEKEYQHAFIPNQFSNESNALAHYLTTGKEILNDLPQIDYLFAGIGTGGTITGISKVIKEQRNIVSIGVEPSDSPLISKGYAGRHSIQGIGANFIPEILDLKLVDEIVTVDKEEAFIFARELSKLEGLFVGISAGACLAATIKYVSNLNEENKNIVIILPDTGERYLSTELIEN